MFKKCSQKTKYGQCILKTPFNHVYVTTFIINTNSLYKSCKKSNDCNEEITSQCIITHTHTFENQLHHKTQNRIQLANFRSRVRKPMIKIQKITMNISCAICYNTEHVKGLKNGNRTLNLDKFSIF